MCSGRIATQEVLWLSCMECDAMDRIRFNEFISFCRCFLFFLSLLLPVMSQGDKVVSWFNRDMPYCLCFLLHSASVTKDLLLVTSCKSS